MDGDTAPAPWVPKPKAYRSHHPAELRRRTDALEGLKSGDCGGRFHEDDSTTEIWKPKVLLLLNATAQVRRRKYLSRRVFRGRDPRPGTADDLPRVDPRGGVRRRLYSRGEARPWHLRLPQGRRVGEGAPCKHWCAVSFSPLSYRHYYLSVRPVVEGRICPANMRIEDLKQQQTRQQRRGTAAEPER